MIGIEFRELVEQDSSVGVVFPPHTFVILNSVDPEEPTINIISAHGSEPVTNASQFPDWDQSLNGCFGPVVRGTEIHCTQEVMVSIALSVIIDLLKKCPKGKDVLELTCSRFHNMERFPNHYGEV